ncbi:hemerythrin domain-containing protein [Aldersonia sp. NBC_00410]|uniref:hemerythrin domain-containing protein n=1 Tax=Aldersonia sp. NBC_00410 TaxID=2975954 RepID=UPI002258E432|nr:hemerythrin domain-containing protein [Aldersonia sp. NBC_00410]MCX5045800.1 hemerythrin domain-containing protein [Aldersonia sp. NBC_00410]
MNINPEGPADTQMMGIVHSALRRDLLRVRLLLTADEPPRGERRTAVADHVLWLMDFLHDHHSGEDNGLYPLVVRRNPAAGALVGQMDADHHLIVPAMDRLTEAARAYRLAQSRPVEPSPTIELLGALDTLSEVMMPHLEREEREMMPVVASSITDAQWRAWDEEFNIKPKSMGKLAKEAMWLLDGIDDDARDHLIHVVPPVPRFLLLRILGPRYRRQLARIWAGTPAEDVPSQPLPVKVGRS